MERDNTELKGAETICTKCRYRALTHHHDLNDLNCCWKCEGKLEIIAILK